jgi:Protein of unknown function (DUF3182)
MSDTPVWASGSTPPSSPATAPAAKAGVAADVAALRQRSLAFHRCNPGSRSRDHDIASKMAVARAIAELLGLHFAGELAEDLEDAGTASADLHATGTPAGGTAARAPMPYLVPSETLDPATAARLGIRTEQDFFGGVVPWPFVGSKVITHPLVANNAAAPEGWSPDFCDAVAAVVLPGHAAFSLADARLAGERLLAAGPVRLKEAGGVGGTGQYVVHDNNELEARLQSLDTVALASEGVVLERNLDEVQTLSVGQVRVGPWLASYCGHQRTTPNHHGEQVYGGSELTVVLGDYEALLGMPLDDWVRTAVEQARVYDLAARRCYPGLLASRCNYDVAQGLDAAGQWRSGVLEQSWRIGGASGAEIAALQAFKDHPGWHWVRASTHECYAEAVSLPPGARQLYDGEDAHVGRLVKYVQVLAHGDL